MKSSHAIVVGLAVLLAGRAWAGAQAPRQAASRAAAADAPTRIAVINIQTAIGATEEGRQKAQELNTQFTPRQNELQGIAKQAQDLQQKLQDGQRTLSDEEKARLANQLNSLQREYQRKQQEMSDDLQDARTDALNSIGTKMVPLITTYARQHGFSIVLDTSQQNTVLYAASSIDITDDLIKLYNQTYPVKAAAAAPKSNQ